MINCPWLHLALKPEPPGGAPQGYSQASQHLYCGKMSQFWKKKHSCFDSSEEKLI